MPAEIYSVVKAACEVYNVPLALALAIAYVESAFNPLAEGDRDARGVPHSFGLFQLHIHGAGAGFTREQLLDLRTNAELGVKYIRQCLDAFPHDLELAISAYNQGIGGAKRRGKSINYHYVQKVLYYMRDLEAQGIPVEGVVTPVEPGGCMGLPLTVISFGWRELWRSLFSRLRRGRSSKMSGT